MWKEYKETFDGVHASQRLKTEVLNMKREENATKRRRVPAAALVAAILVIVLAGTAVAAEYYINRKNVTVEPMEGSYENGYSVKGDMENIPVESLSKAVLERAAQSETENDILPFDSWSEAEAFLGLEIANNARLEKMQTKETWIQIADEPRVSGNCLLRLQYDENGPDMIQLLADYRENDIIISTEAVLRIKSSEAAQRSFAKSNRVYTPVSTETYITPSGLEATVITSSVSSESGDEYFSYEAYFMKNKAYFSVSSAAAGGKPSDEALRLLKEILDAYE